MTDLLPPLDLLLAFMAAGIALNLTPGADMSFAITAAARSGVRGGLAAVLGTAIGGMGHILLAALGLTAVVMAAPEPLNC